MTYERAYGDVEYSGFLAAHALHVYSSSEAWSARRIAAERALHAGDMWQINEAEKAGWWKP